MIPITEDSRWWPYVLTAEEVAALLGVTLNAVRARVRARRMHPPPFKDGRWRRPDVVAYLSDRERVATDWGRARRKAERAPAPPVATGNVREPVTDLRQLPVILKIRDLAAVFRTSEAHIRSQLATYQLVPPPIAKSPWRWNRFDLERYFEHAYEIERDMEDQRRRDRNREAKEKAALQGDPFKAHWYLREATEQLALGDEPLLERLISVANGQLTKVRLLDLPLSTHRRWQAIEAFRALDDIKRRELDTEAIRAAASALVRVTRELGFWIQSERPEVLV